MRRNILIFAIFILVLASVPLLAKTLLEAKKAYNQKHYVKALAILETLAPADADTAQIHLLLGHTASKLEQWDKAIQAFEKVTQIEPESIAAYLQLGFLYEKLKKPEMAKGAWEKVLSIARDEKTKKLAQKHLNNLK